MLASVTTLRCSLSDTADFVAHLEGIGIDSIYLFFDDPDDSAFDTFADRPGIVAYRCDAAYWDDMHGGVRPSTVYERQTRNATLVFHMLLDSVANDAWLLHIDADERLLAARPLVTLLSEAPRAAHAVRFATAEAVPECLRPQSVARDTTLFRRPIEAPLRISARSRFVAALYRMLSTILAATFRPRRRLAKYLGCTGAFEYGFFRGHAYGKCATRVRHAVDHISVHRPKMGSRADAGPFLCHEAWLLHYDCCSVELWQEKWQRRLDGTPGPTMRATRLEQLREYGAAAESADPRAFEQAYREIYFLSAYQKLLLRMMGFLVRIPEAGGLITTRKEEPSHFDQG